MSKDIAVRDDDQVMRLISVAVEKKVDVEQLRQLMDLKREHDAAIAKQAFFAALAKFQSLVPVIEKKKTVQFDTRDGGKTHYKYAGIDAIAEAIKPALIECGLCYRFAQDESQGITVTCHLTHVLGHTESATMRAMPDTSGKKNAIQANASAVTYLRRYTLTGVLGIVTADSDDDGQTAGAQIEPEATDKKPEPESLPPYDDAKLDQFLVDWKADIAAKQTTPERIIKKISTRFTLTDKQKKRIEGLA